MGRAAWPPNSFTEWMVGQNFRDTPRRASGQTPILKVCLSEDEVSGDEKLEITYPGRHRSSRNAKQPSLEALSARKVRFDRDRKPLKSALKKTASPSASSDTLVDDSSEDPVASDDSSSAVEDSDISEDETWVRKKSGRQAHKRTKAAAICKKGTDSEDSSAVKDDLPHPRCHCKDCSKGRKILKAMVKLEAMQEAAKSSAKDEGKDKQNGKHNGKQKGKKKGKKNDSTSAEASETTQTDDTEDDKKKESPKQKNKKGSPKENDKKPAPKEDKKVSPKTTELTKAVNKDAFKLPKYPKSMEPNLIMPVRTKVLQCEHTVEGPNDPHPNAFIDSGKGIVRVYHGPMWGNHTGELYGRVNPDKSSSSMHHPARPYPQFHGFPPGPPGPPGFYGPPPYGPHPPYSHAGPPPGTPYTKQMPPGPPDRPSVHNAQIPDDSAMTKAASKGLGLTGQPWPQTPACLREGGAQEQQKAQTEAANNVWPSQGAGSWKATQGNTNAQWDSGPNQGWGSGGGGNNEWSGDTGVDTGGNPSGDGIAQKYDFSGWGSNKGGFQRTSNKSNKSGNGSQKGGRSAGSNQGGNNDWGNSGNNGSGGGDNGWDAKGADNDNWNTTSNAGNDNQWATGSNTGHNWKNGTSNGDGWNDTNQNAAQGGAGGDTWGVPTGSKPHSQHASKPSSNAGGWGNSGWSAGDDNNAVPGPIPGAWTENGGTQSRKPSDGSNRPPHEWNQNNNGGSGGGNSRRGSPNGKLIGAFAWPEGCGSPPGQETNGWNKNGGYNGPPGSPAGNWNGASGGNGGWNGGPPAPQQAAWSNGYGGNGGNGGWLPAPPGSRAPSQNGGGGWSVTNQQQGGGNSWGEHRKTGGSPVAPWNAAGGGGGGDGGGGWSGKPSHNNAGPPPANMMGSWANLDLAQDTGGKADNW